MTRQSGSKAATRLASPTPSQSPDLGERLVGQQVAGRRGVGHHRAGEQLRVAAAHLLEHRRAGREVLPGEADQRVAAAVLLPAPSPAALARQAARHHLHVAELAGHAVHPAVQASAQDDTAADARCRASPGSRAGRRARRRTSPRRAPRRWRRSPGPPGTPQRFSSVSRTGASSQGRCGANITRSPSASTKPAAATPTPAISSSAGDRVDRLGERVLDHAYVDPTARRRPPRRADDPCPCSSTTPASTLVPPTSTPIQTRSLTGPVWRIRCRNPGMVSSDYAARALRVILLVPLTLALCGYLDSLRAQFLRTGDHTQPRGRHEQAQATRTVRQPSSSRSCCPSSCSSSWASSSSASTSGRRDGQQRRPRSGPSGRGRRLLGTAQDATTPRNSHPQMTGSVTLSADPLRSGGRRRPSPSRSPPTATS